MQKIFSFIFSVTVLMLSAAPILATQDLRIVSVGSGVTETIYALGAQQDLVGVDTSSTWPEAAKQLPQIGYQRTLSAEGILSLKPNLVIGTEQTGPEVTLQQLRQAKVKVLILPSTPTLETVKLRINTIAEVVHKQHEGVKLWQKIQKDLDQAKQLQNNTTSKRVLLLLSVPGRSPLAAGKETEADLILSLAAAQNVVSDFSGYRILTPEAIQALNPDIIIITEDGKGSADIKALSQQPGIKSTNAAKNRAIIAMNTNLLLSLGPRLGQAVLDLTKKLNNEIEMKNTQSQTRSS